MPARMLFFTLALVGSAEFAFAEVKVVGPAEALRVTAREHKLSDVLSSVASHLGGKYRTAIELEALTSGTYSGSLGQVMSRLLDRYNYVIKQNGEQREIIVLGKRGGATMPAPAAAAPSVASRWR